MNAKYFIHARAHQTATYSARDGLHELCLEAIDSDLKAIGYDDPELVEYYMLCIRKTFTHTYGIPMPPFINVLIGL